MKALWPRGARKRFKTAAARAQREAWPSRRGVVEEKGLSPKNTPLLHRVCCSCSKHIVPARIGDPLILAYDGGNKLGQKLDDGRRRNLFDPREEKEKPQKNERKKKDKRKIKSEEGIRNEHWILGSDIKALKALHGSQGPRVVFIFYKGNTRLCFDHTNFSVAFKPVENLFESEAICLWR
ncbi:armadillo/beta-catenin repeat family protein /kinesin motor family protein [Striga asiatica]|uniref:Armadillo/beta-catenin repeat family protein /kinesin motor family protein n=1 Tax=Striga asiatica TaxID=4170 RepID=A0A5A7PCV8_STRAF|nr:armadillo/beta-catenin repeat family protein /kinesin motor family protein [Striga asiatica]